jgi:hypothetical protein
MRNNACQVAQGNQVGSSAEGLRPDLQAIALLDTFAVIASAPVKCGRVSQHDDCPGGLLFP